MFLNKTVLITGATGSVGQVLCKYFVKQEIKKLIVYSRDEYKQFHMKNLEEFKNQNIEYVIGDIRNYESIKKASLNVDYLIHTAALKHVEICEQNPLESISINVEGSKNIINAGLENNIEKVLFISTDKANNPNNTYGASKLLGDKLCIDANKYSKTKFSVIRFGNIFGSRGSLVEKLFNNNLKDIYLTDEKIARVFISWKDLLDNIIHILETMYGGEIFIPINKSIYIKDLITIINPKLRINITGLKEGEKLVETLLSRDEISNTIKIDNMYIIKSKWCHQTYQKYKRVEKDTKYTSIDNEFYTKSEIERLINLHNKIF